ncbi:hypothetical protein Pint_02541 [Pistacia integerrima]|uniref:Uncharacterized protein n=1 Tax=Pistacia integerrima TaxID=434235 RepID=A0ACC0ZLA6_9ROSI|nr:hypothetical protein Pint_02541 [Pistacia integerrima]
MLITEDNIKEMVSNWSGIPVEKIPSEESHQLLRMGKTLQKHIIGQAEAVEAISRAIRRARAGIRDPSRPISSFLFTGPTGVGKTELAKALAVEYFGSENGGQLTEAVLDGGRLTDNKGQTVDFKNTIIIMTSNIGGNLIFKKSHLGPLSNSQLKEIVEIMLKQVYERLKEKNIKVEVTERFKEEIVKEGYNPSYGARPLRRAIGRLLEDNLAERILNGSIKQGDSVTINVDSNGKILPEAVEAVSRAVRKAKVGIGDPSKPLSGFLFAGSKGVGKTVLAKALAVEYFRLKKSLIRTDMSEYMERHTVSKFLGSPPGYRGYEDGSQLTEAVLDDGHLTDNKGKTVSFNHTFIIMTSNVGSDIIANESHMGYDEVKMKVTEELKKKFKPEFLNRFDELIVFRQLTCAELKEIVEIMLNGVYQRAKSIKINLEVTEKFMEELARQGNDPAYGARPLKRAIRRLVEDTLAE